MCGVDVLGSAQRGVDGRSAFRASNPAGVGAAIVRPRQHDARLLHRQLPRGLDQHAGRPVNVVQIVVGPTGLVGASEHAILAYIQSTFADGPKPDLIMTVAGPAALFARKHRQQLFPEIPLLFAAVDERFLRAAPLAENETAVAVGNDLRHCSMKSYDCCRRPSAYSW